MSEREEGHVKNWFEEKGFGFVRCSDGTDLFMHISATGFIIPKAGCRVAFSRGNNPRTNKPEAQAASILSD
jgi:cold shock CspA family protein